jgi:Protein of unknown function (DUF1176)
MGKPSSAWLLASTLLFGTPIGATIPQHIVAPDPVQVFKDWAVGCDNIRTCEAIPLAKDGVSIDNLSLVFGRDAGPNGKIHISISGFASKSDRYKLLVDNKLVDTGPLLPGEVPVEVNGKEAVKLARAILRGSILRLVDGEGVKLGQASLAGASAALRYIDAAQGRTRTVTALVSKGKKPGGMKTPDLPAIQVPRITPTDSIPDAASLVALAEGSSCAGERLNVTQDTAYSLGKSDNIPRALALISCGSGAYNISTAVYVGTQAVGGKWTFEPAQFDYGPNVKNAAGDLHVLVNSGWDSKTQTINSYAKYRGIGDCGRAETYVWDGKIFRLTRAAAMEECRGASDWITVWRAEVKLIG